MSSKLETLVYITGSGRSGSTLLDMLLSTHSDVAALGEAHRFSMNLGKSTPPYRCTCGETIECCDFWRNVMVLLGEENVDPYELKTTWACNETIGENDDGTNIVELVPETALYKIKINLFNVFLSFGLGKVIQVLASLVSNFKEGINISKNSWLLYENVCASNKKKIVVDGSKTPGRLLGLMAFNKHQHKIKVIYLCRDGKAVTHARMKRQSLSMSEAVKIWTVEHQKISVALKRHKGDVLYVTYEKLCVDTKKELQRVFQFIGAQGIAKKASFRDCSHSLGGNPMRLRKAERTIALNEKWRDELTQDDLATFEKIGGKLNRRLGYE